MDYIGDEEFNGFLEEIKFPRILPEIKAIVMRSLWRIKFKSMQEVIKEIESGFQFPDIKTAEMFFGNFMELWNVLVKNRDIDGYFRFVRFPKVKAVKELQTRIYVRNLEIQGLFPLVADGAQDIPAEFNDEFQKITEPISTAVDEMKVILGSTMIPFENSKLSEWEAELDRLDTILEEAFNRLGWMLVKIRCEHAPAIQQVDNPRKIIGRNDPCPCGSGKKFKRCCLEKMN